MTDREYWKMLLETADDALVHNSDNPGRVRSIREFRNGLMYSLNQLATSTDSHGQVELLNQDSAGELGY